LEKIEQEIDGLLSENIAFYVGLTPEFHIIKCQKGMGILRKMIDGLFEYRKRFYGIYNRNCLCLEKRCFLLKKKI